MTQFWLLFVVVFLLVARQIATVTVQSCKDGEIQCGTSEECVLKDQLCDSWADCSNEWDEGFPACPCDGFECPNTTTCIPSSWVCDADMDCPGGEDEQQNCLPQLTCNNGFKCDEKCIPADWQCDNDKDCNDGSDELNCSTRPPGGCFENEFLCDDGNCIPGQSKCDAFPDCNDGSDETRLNCPCEGMLCPDGSKCINPTWLCDYVEDCPDGSDEGEECNYTITRRPEQQIKLAKLRRQEEFIMKMNKISRKKIQKSQKLVAIKTT